MADKINLIAQQRNDIVEHLLTVTPSALQEYCDVNSRICSDEKLWDELIRRRFPHIHSLLLDIDFSYLPLSITAAPLRDLYAQLLLVSENPKLDYVIEALIKDVYANYVMHDITEQYADEYEHDRDFEDVYEDFEKLFDDLRLYYRVLSYVLGVVFEPWHEHLYSKDDALLQQLPVDLEELRLRWRTAATLRYLEDPRNDPSVNDNAALRLFAAVGDANMVVHLLADPRVDPAVGGDTALQIAAENGHVDIVRLLLSNPHIDIARRGYISAGDSALSAAAGMGHISVVRLLLSDPRVEPHLTALNAAAINNHPEIVALLLADGRIEPAARNNEARNNEALVGAVKRGYTDVVKVLLSDPRVINAKLDKALDSATDKEIKKLIVEKMSKQHKR